MSLRYCFLLEQLGKGKWPCEALWRSNAYGSRRKKSMVGVSLSKANKALSLRITAKLALMLGDN